MLEEKICPYPGLRPFNEDESIFFRGREEHIEKIISQLEEKKFVMLTGASGDGKSSIVYAGVIPNARAGFFKAKFNSWQIADFRPERSPLRNMAIAIAGKLGYSDVGFVEKELGFGFSSLIDLYKKSPYYLDQNGAAWNAADDAEKKKLKRKAANLFVLVDQFEEFFTNSENYHNGKASDESQAVINLLLETARIALAEDLPIYIICTMRSDYIGQCAAFRGLPEYIGFSQFFVPRLKRKEIHQVIEEPATLSGNTISNRLTETLINELGEGFDQLPVLQHALNQVWKQANKGHQEMDLIHLAKLSGLAVSALPAEDKIAFSKWFKMVPEFKKGFFNSPSLESVLNAHANELYQTASEYYNSKHEEKISKEDSATIIKATFQCLTKIDDSRAVRNRMTLEEITQVINRPEITTELVSGTLEIFRLQGNTFLKPFATSDPSSLILDPNDVLDITHESLIRNWDLLSEWAKEEYDNWLNFQDFNKQLQRWISSNKAKGYLLPIGPLTFFENWYNECKPNKYWLARYDESDLSKEEKLIKAEAKLLLADEFIKKSSKRLFFSRFVLKHGASKIVTIALLSILPSICIHYYWDYRKKQNDWVVENVLEQKGMDMLSSSKIANWSKATFLINLERLDPGYTEELLNDLENDTMAFDIAHEMFARIHNHESVEKTNDKVNPLTYPLLHYMDKRLDNLTNRQRVVFDSTKTYDLSRVNSFLGLCAYVKSYGKNPEIDKLVRRNSWVLNRLLSDILERPLGEYKGGTTLITNSLQLLLALAPETDFKYYIEKLSPFAMDDAATARFNEIYPEENKFYRCHGFQLLSYLYATQRDPGSIDLVMSCMDMVRASNYGDFPFVPIYGVINTLVKYDNFSMETMDRIVEDYCKTSFMDVLTFRNKILADENTNHVPYELINEGNIYPYLAKYFYTKVQKETLWNDHLNALNKILETGKYFTYPYVSSSRISVADKADKFTASSESAAIKEITPFTEDDYKFQAALFYKKTGSYYKDIYKDASTSLTYFNKAFEYYSALPQTYREGTYVLGAANRGDSKEIITRAFRFLYPGTMNEFITFRYTQSGSSTDWTPFPGTTDENFSPAFFDFIRNNKVSVNYSNAEGIALLKKFCYLAYEAEDGKDTLSYNCAEMMNQLRAANPVVSIDPFAQNFYKLIFLSRKLQSNVMDTSLIKEYHEMEMEKLIADGFSNPHKAGGNEAWNHNMLIWKIAKQLALKGYLDESFGLINTIQESEYKRNLLIDIAYELQSTGPVENTFVYLDSVFKNNDIDKKPKFGLKLIQVLAMVGSQNSFDLATLLMKDVNELAKPTALQNYVKGVAFNGFYYQALQAIPEYVSSNKELNLYNSILEVEIQKRSTQNTEEAAKMRKGWISYDKAVSEASAGMDREGINGQIIGTLRLD